MRFGPERQRQLQSQGRRTNPASERKHGPGQTHAVANPGREARDGRLSDPATAAIHHGQTGEKLRGRVFAEEPDGPLPQQGHVYRGALSATQTPTILSSKQQEAVAVTRFVTAPPGEMSHVVLYVEARAADGAYAADCCHCLLSAAARHAGRSVRR